MTPIPCSSKMFPVWHFIGFRTASHRQDKGGGGPILDLEITHTSAQNLISLHTDGAKAYCFSACPSNDGQLLAAGLKLTHVSKHKPLHHELAKRLKVQMGRR